MPFWMEHCIDDEHGGINNCVGDDGVVQTTDKVLWSQARAVWTFSALYNHLDQDERWLAVAKNIAEFIMEHGRDEQGRWVFKLHEDGSVAEGWTSIYVDAFAMYGLTEYAAATGDGRARELAVETYRLTSPMLADHTSFPTMPHPIPEGLQSHGPSMMFALVYHELGVLLGDEEILGRALELAEIVMTEHVKPEAELLYELVEPNSGGRLVDSDAGNTFLAGHVIESMWFMERIYQYHGRAERVKLALEAIRWHLEKGWDDEYGGLFLACHAKGGKAVWHQPDAKVWWPHTEALYALLRAYEVCGEKWCRDWYWRIHEYSFRVFPDREHGEWHQNCDREGRVCAPVIKGFVVKDPFHLPRALVYSILVLRRLAVS